MIILGVVEMSTLSGWFLVVGQRGGCGLTRPQSAGLIVRDWTASTTSRTFSVAYRIVRYLYERFQQRLSWWRKSTNAIETPYTSCPKWVRWPELCGRKQRDREPEGSSIGTCWAGVHDWNRVVDFRA